MRIFATCSLVLMFIVLISLIGSDLRRASKHSAVDEVLVVRYYQSNGHQQIEPSWKDAQIHLEKEISYDSVQATHEPKTFTLAGRKLLGKLRESQEELSNTDYKNSEKKLSHGRTRKRRSKKREKKKNAHRTDEGGVGVFTEDYRVPRPHPPRNN